MSEAPRRAHRRSSTPVERMRTDVKRRRAFEMSTVLNAPIETIATELEVSRKTVMNWLESERKKNRMGLSFAAKIIRDRRNKDLEKLINHWMPIATDPDMGQARRGLQATDVIGRLIGMQAKINGIDTIKVDLESGGVPVTEAIIAAVRNLALPKPVHVVRELENHES